MTSSYLLQPPRSLAEVLATHREGNKTMTPLDQRKFVHQLIDNVEAEIIAKLKSGKIPAEWDGHELRQYVADNFAECVMWPIGTDNRSARRREYANTVLVNNL